MDPKDEGRLSIEINLTRLVNAQLFFTIISKSLVDDKKQTKNTHKQHKHEVNKHIYIYTRKNCRLFKSPKTHRAAKKRGGGGVGNLD